MVGISEISGLIASLKGARDLAEAMVGLRDTAAFQGKVIEFQGVIMDAQQRVFSVQEERSTLIQKVAELEKKIASLEDWEAQKQRYKLKDLGNGTLAYALKTAMSDGEPPHNICATCYQNGTKSIIQPETRSGRVEVFVCNRCGSELIPEGERQAEWGAPQKPRRPSH